MEPASEDAPLTVSPAGSEQVLIQPSGPARGSNSRALKIAGITTLVCLLVSAQVFTAYMLFDQKQQVHDLQMTNQDMQRQMQRSKVPQKIMKPMESLRLLDFDDLDSSYLTTPKPSPKPLPKVQLQASPSVEEQLQEFMEDFEAPQFNNSFLINLQNMKDQVNETLWKNFESWMRYWLMFQMAQKASATGPKTKCQMEAVGLEGMVGNYRPQCDEDGNYKTMQCWSAKRQCWCVDQSGKPFEGSFTQGHVKCDRFLRASRHTMMSDALDVVAK